MRTRSILALLAVIALVAAQGAGAATKKKKPPAPKPKTYCNLLVDPAGDGDIAPGVNDKGIDILGGDLATGKKTMVAVLRLADTNYSVSHDPWTLTGFHWSFQAVSSYGQNYGFSANEYMGTVTGSATVDNAAVTLKSFTIDTVHNTFTWVLDRSVDKTLTRKGTIFRGFSGQSMRLSSTADAAPNNAATMKATYPDQGLSCVHAS